MLHQAIFCEVGIGNKKDSSKELLGSHVRVVKRANWFTLSVVHGLQSQGMAFAFCFVSGCAILCVFVAANIANKVEYFSASFFCENVSASSLVWLARNWWV